MADGGMRSDAGSGWRILRGDGDGRVDHLPGAGMSGGLVRQPQQQGGHHVRARAACWRARTMMASTTAPELTVDAAYLRVHPRPGGDYSPRFGRLAIGFLLPAVATLGLGLPPALKSV